MLYKDAPKKQSLNLRIHQAVIDRVVEEPGALRCTHFDAFRFFDDGAKPLNLHRDLDRVKQPRYEQPACVHYNMDFFKFALRLAPFIDATLLADALDVALKARTLDLRASPYDLTRCHENSVDFDISPVPVELPAGRKLYTELQADVSRHAAPVRRRLADACRHVISAYENHHNMLS